MGREVPGTYRNPRALFRLSYRICCSIFELVGPVGKLKGAHCRGEMRQRWRGGGREMLLLLLAGAVLVQAAPPPGLRIENGTGLEEAPMVKGKVRLLSLLVS